MSIYIARFSEMVTPLMRSMVWLRGYWKGATSNHHVFHCSDWSTDDFFRGTNPHLGDTRRCVHDFRTNGNLYHWIDRWQKKRNI